MNRKLSEDLELKIKRKNENIQILKKLIDERTNSLKTLKENSQRLFITNRDTKKLVPSYITKCQHFADYIEKTFETNNKLVAERSKLQEELKQVIRKNIQKLIKFIFPLSHTISRGETNDGSRTSLRSDSDTMNALAEATHTAYVRGRWVLQDSQSELQHVIVAPSLPGSGDYSAYNDWVEKTKDGVPNSSGSTETWTSTNCAYRISAALTYTTQLVHLLSFFLDVRLPYRLNYR